MHKIISLMSLAAAAVATKYTVSKNFTNSDRRFMSPVAASDDSSLKTQDTLQKTVRARHQNQDMYKDNIADIDHVCLAHLNVGAESENVYDSPLIDSSITISNDIFPMNLFADSEIYNAAAKLPHIPAVNDRAKKVASKIAINNEHFISKRHLNSTHNSSKDATSTKGQSDDSALLHSSIEELESVFHKKVESEVLSHNLPADSSYSDPSIIKSIYSDFDLSLASILGSVPHITFSLSDSSNSKNKISSGKDATITNNLETMPDEKRNLSSLTAVYNDTIMKSPVALPCVSNDTGSESILLNYIDTQSTEDHCDDSSSPLTVVEDLESDSVVLQKLSPNSTDASDAITGLINTTGSSQNTPITPSCSSADIIESHIPITADVISENNIETLTQVTSSVLSDSNTFDASSSANHQITATIEPGHSLANDDQSHGKSNLTIHTAKVKSSPQSVPCSTGDYTYVNRALQPESVSLDSHSYYGGKPCYHPDHQTYPHSSPRTLRHLNAPTAAQTSDQNYRSFEFYSVPQEWQSYGDKIKSHFSRQHMSNIPAEGINTRYSDTFTSYNSESNIRKQPGIVRSENILNQQPNNIFEGHSADVDIYNRENYRSRVSTPQHSNTFGSYGSTSNQNNVFGASVGSGYMASKVPEASHLQSGLLSKSTFKGYADPYIPSHSERQAEWHSRVSSTSYPSGQQHATSAKSQFFSIDDLSNYPIHTFIGEDSPVSRPPRSHNTAGFTHSQRFTAGGNSNERGTEQSGSIKSITSSSSYNSQNAYGSSSSSTFYPRKEFIDNSYSLGKKLKMSLGRPHSFTLGDIKGFNVPGISVTGSESTAGYSSVHNFDNSLGVPAGLRTSGLYSPNFIGYSENFSGQQYLSSPGIHRTYTTQDERFRRPTSFEYVGSGIAGSHTQVSSSHSGTSGNNVRLDPNFYKPSSMAYSIKPSSFHVNDPNKTLKTFNVNSPAFIVLQSGYGLESNVANVKAISIKENPASSQYAATKKKSEEDVENDQDNEAEEC